MYAYSYVSPWLLSWPYILQLSSTVYILTLSLFLYHNNGE